MGRKVLIIPPWIHPQDTFKVPNWAEFFSVNTEKTTEELFMKFHDGQSAGSRFSRRFLEEIFCICLRLTSC